MDFMQRVELFSGIATGLLWLAVSLAMCGSIGNLDVKAIVESLFGSFVWFGIVGLLVAYGAYAHVMRQKSWGRSMLTVGTVLLVAFFLFFFFALAGYWGMSIAAATMLPPCAAVMTWLAARSNDYAELA